MPNPAPGRCGMTPGVTPCPAAGALGPAMAIPGGPEGGAPAGPEIRGPRPWAVLPEAPSFGAPLGGGFGFFFVRDLGMAKN